MVFDWIGCISRGCYDIQKMKKEHIILIAVLIIGIILYLTREKITQIVMGIVIPEKLKPIIDKMKADASKAGVYLSVGSGLRTYDQQLALRKSNVIDRSKVNDISYLKNADNSLFNPVTAKPGTSNHETGLAIDFNVTGNDKAFNWLFNNALSYGFVRTVPSERWHWEYRPGTTKFAFVPQTNPTWKTT